MLETGTASYLRSLSRSRHSLPVCSSRLLPFLSYWETSSRSVPHSVFLISQLLWSPNSSVNPPLSYLPVSHVLQTLFLAATTGPAHQPAARADSATRAAHSPHCSQLRLWPVLRPSISPAASPLLAYFPELWPLHCPQSSLPLVL